MGRYILVATLSAALASVVGFRTAEWINADTAPSDVRYVDPWSDQPVSSPVTSMFIARDTELTTDDLRRCYTALKSDGFPTPDVVLPVQPDGQVAAFPDMVHYSNDQLLTCARELDKAADEAVAQAPADTLKIHMSRN